LEKDLFLIEGGAAQIMRVLMNLIKNSKEALTGGGLIAIKTENVYLDKPLNRDQRIKKGEYVKVQISDTGSGIPPKILEKIFDPFFTTKRMDKQRGTGLGLSIVHSIMDDHKGYISVHSAVGKGTTFSLFFPVSKKLNVENVIPLLKGGHEKILIVDDDPLQRSVSTELLRRLGYKISCVDSGQEAIVFIKDRPQDIILMDMLMAGLNGAETYSKILELYPRQKAIIITGYSMTKQIRDALNLGAGAYLTKPVTLLALGTAIRKELDRKPGHSFEP
jgi:CheY-like chemotaxis protein